MLPERLSNGLCSLNPEVDRLYGLRHVIVHDTGGQGTYRFYPR